MRFATLFTAFGAPRARKMAAQADAIHTIW
jgi:hypothetical protein